LPPPIARALADRSYAVAMPVQAAVLDARCAGRDLLVSSQTGSGKTLAFGIAIGQSLLPEGAEKINRRPTPSALVIVPTRELGIQVREELTWLLRHTGARLASFTGGTPVGGDLAALKRGVDVAIGTPGRLVDLVRRERLDLAGIGTLVLDEADEMLDLGFREDLEALLEVAPDSRRTLLLSATLPPAIRELARRFQRDALPVDPRVSQVGPDGVVTGGAAGRPQTHDDISYLAHLIAGGDRLAAVVNILRASDAERAIVFCTTRDAVGELHAALLARGFAATAISGERAQTERDRALDQVRRGEARVLVATNVAARGIHLPDVDLIIHADLPLNAESLTHRSGRTGRAGRKGTAILLATPTERRKAERLLAAVNVRPTWTAPPSADAIARAAGERLVGELSGDASAVPEARAAAVDELVARLSERLSSAELVRRLAARELARLPSGERLRPVALPSFDRDRRGFDAAAAPAGRRRSPAEMARDGVLFRVNIGARDKAEARWLLPLICRRGAVTNREVGAIRIGPVETWFEIAGDAADDFAHAAAETDPRAPHVRIERAPARGGGAPERSRRPPPERVAPSSPSSHERPRRPPPERVAPSSPSSHERPRRPPPERVEAPLASPPERPRRPPPERVAPPPAPTPVVAPSAPSAPVASSASSTAGASQPGAATTPRSSSAPSPRRDAASAAGRPVAPIATIERKIVRTPRPIPSTPALRREASSPPRRETPPGRPEFTRGPSRAAEPERRGPPVSRKAWGDAPAGFKPPQRWTRPPAGAGSGYTGDRPPYAGKRRPEGGPSAGAGARDRVHQKPKAAPGAANASRPSGGKPGHLRPPATGGGGPHRAPRPAPRPRTRP